MENLLLIFENISSVNRAVIIISGITFFWVIEGIVPFKFLNYKKKTRMLSVLFNQPYTKEKLVVEQKNTLKAEMVL